MLYTASNTGKSVVIDFYATLSLRHDFREMEILQSDQSRNRISVPKKPTTKAERKALRRKQEQVNRRNKLLGKY